MRWIIVAIASLGLNSRLVAAEPPLVEKYLHSGQLTRGEQVLESALAVAPGDDQIRFGLAVLQLVRGVERLGQTLHEYGCLTKNNNAPFLRIPIPHNPDPSPITYAAFRRMLAAFQADLSTVEVTLAGVKSQDVKLPLRLAEIRMDLTGSGNAGERFIEILKKLMGPAFRLHGDNSQFLVCFDRGDVAWLRAYCHLLMGMIDVQLAVNTEAEFDLMAGQQFAKPKHRFESTIKQKWEKQEAMLQVIVVTEPARLRHFREHTLKVCELNRETWSFIRAESDNDHEWLPNSKQIGVLRMPVTDQMIDAWLFMVSEIEGIFDGTKAIPEGITQWLSPSTSKQMSLKLFLDAPPEEIDWARIQSDGIRDTYLNDTLPEVNIRAFVGVFQAFQAPLAVGYAVWFN